MRKRTPIKMVFRARCLSCEAGQLCGLSYSHRWQGFAGGRILRSEFGDFVTPNISPDKTTGHWYLSADEFWRALHNGKGKDGRLLYPAFPFENYTHITRADADAMWAYLQTVPAVQQSNPDHQLRSPYDQRWMLAWWRSEFPPGALHYEARESAAGIVALIWCVDLPIAAHAQCAR